MFISDMCCLDQLRWKEWGGGVGQALRLEDRLGGRALRPRVVKLRHFLGRALRLGQARGPRAAATA